MRTVSAKSLARAECANFQNDGTCIGVGFDRMCWPAACEGEPCVVGKPGERCGYFEVVVLPLAKRASLKAHEYPGAARDYYRLIGRDAAPVLTLRKCPECGDPLPIRKRFCDRCRAARRRRSERESRRRREMAENGVPVRNS